MFERFTDRARRVVVLAQEEAKMLNHNYIGTEHILLGLIREGEGVAAQVLVKLGADLNRVRQQVIQLPEGSYDDPPTAETITGIGNRKNEAVVAAIAAGEVEVYPGSLRDGTTWSATTVERPVPQRADGCRVLFPRDGGSSAGPAGQRRSSRCSNGSPTEPAAWSSWPRKRPGCSTTTTSGPSTSSLA